MCTVGSVACCNVASLPEQPSNAFHDLQVPHETATRSKLRQSGSSVRFGTNLRLPSRRSASVIFLFPLGNPHTKPRRFFPKNCPGHPPKQPTTQQSFFHLRLPGPTASATLTVGSCKHLGQDIHTHAVWPGLKRADRDWGAEDIFPAPPLPGTKKRVKIANKRSPLLTHRTP